jgi:hypothetical protein
MRYVRELLPHAVCIAQVGAVRDQLIGIAGAAEPDIDAPAAQNVECRHALREMQEMVNWRQHDADAKADAFDALADCRQCQVRRALLCDHRGGNGSENKTPPKPFCSANGICSSASQMRRASLSAVHGFGTWI